MPSKLLLIAYVAAVIGLGLTVGMAQFNVPDVSLAVFRRATYALWMLAFTGTVIEWAVGRAS